MPFPSNFGCKPLMVLMYKKSDYKIMIKWAAAERSYPASEVSGGREETPCVWGQGQWRRGATLRPRPVAAGRRHPMSEIRRGQEKPPHARGQGGWPWGATPSPRPGPAAGRSNPRSCTGTGGPRGAIPRWRSGTAAVRRYPSSKVRSSDCALLEQAVKRYPPPKVRETQVRW